MHVDLGYTYIGETSFWRLTWPEIRVALEGLRQIQISQNSASTAGMKGTNPETERYRDRMKKQSKSRARERFKQSRGLA